jgi:hypothetical protein
LAEAGLVEAGLDAVVAARPGRAFLPAAASVARPGSICVRPITATAPKHAAAPAAFTFIQFVTSDLR